MKFSSKFPSLEIGQFFKPEWLPAIRENLKGRFLLDTQQGEQWFEIEFAKKEFGPYGRLKLFFICPKCRAKTKTLFLKRRLQCRKCLKHQYQSTRFEWDSYHQNVIRPLKELGQIEGKLVRRFPRVKKDGWMGRALSLAEDIQEKALEESVNESEQLDKAWGDFFQERREREKFCRELAADFQSLIKLSDTDPKRETAHKEFNRKLKMGPKFQ